MKLRWRITILTAIMIALASSAIGIASYVNISQAQLSSIDSNLQSALGPNFKRVLDRPLGRGNGLNEFYVPVAIGVIGPRGNLVEVRPAGTQSAPEIFPNVPVAEILADPNQAMSFSNETTGDSYRLIARPGGRDSLVFAVTSLNGYVTTMNQILVSTILFVFGITILGALASWLIVRKFFTPVDSMIASAGAIARGDISQRVPHAPAGTELGNLSESLNHMINSLTDSITRVQDSERFLRNFISDASHEIRTPLTVIRGYTEILRADNSLTSERDVRALERIDSESERLERLVTSLLELDTRQNVVSPAMEIKLDELISLHFNDLQAFSQRPITYDLEAIHIEGDPAAWEQLLGNVTQNITRYTPAHSEVRVALHPIAIEDTDWVELVIEDCGPGIPVDKRLEVFSRFSRLDPSRSTQTGGFGLGMSIIKAVVEAHSGVVELDQSPCGGLQIRILVPRIRA